MHSKLYRWRWKSTSQCFFGRSPCFRGNNKCWGVRHGAADPADGILKAVTLDTTFDVVLSQCYVDKLDDDAKQDAVNELHTRFEAIYCDLVNTKAGVPLNVLLVDQPSIAAPELLVFKGIKACSPTKK